MFFVQLIISAVLFLGGGYGGLRFAQCIAPDSAFASLSGFTMLPLAFISGMIAWQGFAIIAMLFGAKSKQTDGGEVPPGSIGLLIASIVVCGLAGGIVWMFNASTTDLVPVLGKFLGVGAGYGALCWILARVGLLPMMES